MYLITILFDVHCYNFVARVHSWYHCLICKKNNKLNVTIFESKWIYLILYKIIVSTI